jgi:tRNA A-37 threonylcarbamoyl transferase component Bud32
VIKHGPHRTVYHVALPGLDFYLKHYRLADLRTWLRQIIRPAKARMEFDRALAVAARQVPTITPLGLGEGCARPGPSESFLVTRGLDNVEPLNIFIEQKLPTFDRSRSFRIRQRLAKELGHLMGRMHNAGIIHRDLHAANLLVRLDRGDWPRLYLVDLHAVHLGRPLSWTARCDNLVMLNRWFVLRVGRVDRLRFWRAYSQFSQFPSRWDDKDLDWERLTELERRTWESNLRFWRNRDRRCLATNRYYERVRGPNTRGHVIRGLSPDTVKALFADPDEPFRRPGARLLKDSPSSTVTEFEVMVDGVPRPVIYKRFRVTSWTDPWAALLRVTPTLRSWVFGHGLLERCLPTARPLAVLHRRRFGRSYEGYLLTEKIPDAVDLHGLVARLGTLAPTQRRERMRQCIDQVAAMVRELHRRHLTHRDLKAANILLTRDRVWLIDLVGVRRHRQLPAGRQVQNLARLNASFIQNAHLTRTDKLRFLSVYLEWGLVGRVGWKSWWQEIEQATLLKVARNQRSGRPLS